MVSTKPKTRRNRSLTTGRRSVGGAPSPIAFLAQTQGNPKEWVQVGLTRAWVVRRHRKLSLQVWSTQQDRSSSAIIYNLYSTTSSRQKILHQHQASRCNVENQRLHQYTWREQRSQDNKSCSRSHDSSRPQFVSWKPSNSSRNILGPLDSLNPINLKGVSTRFSSR
jgi:hypothetical protein